YDFGQRLALLIEGQVLEEQRQAVEGFANAQLAHRRALAIHLDVSGLVSHVTGGHAQRGALEIRERLESEDEPEGRVAIRRGARFLPARGMLQHEVELAARP